MSASISRDPTSHVFLVPAKMKVVMRASPGARFYYNGDGGLICTTDKTPTTEDLSVSTGHDKVEAAVPSRGLASEHRVRGQGPAGRSTTSARALRQLRRGSRRCRAMLRSLESRRTTSATRRRRPRSTSTPPTSRRPSREVGTGRRKFDQSRGGPVAVFSPSGLVPSRMCGRLGRRRRIDDSVGMRDVDAWEHCPQK